MSSSLIPHTPSDFLRALYLQKKKGRSQYSTRAFARDLGMSQTLLSLILNGKRSLTLSQATRVAALLGLSESQSEHLLNLTLAHLPQNAKLSKRVVEKLQPIRLEIKNASNKNNFMKLCRVLGTDEFHLISHWYTLAILDLATTEGFKSDPLWISRRLKIHPEQAKESIERLLELGLMSRQPNGQLVKTSQHLSFKNSKSEAAIRNYHRQMIEKAGEHLSRDSVEAYQSRSISAATLAIRKDKIAIAKDKIEKFKTEMAELLTEGSSQEVYQLNVQFFPLSE